MSTDRNSSAVRNLRSIFETKSSESPSDSRGRSSSGLTAEREGSRPTSKVRASFVSVERPVSSMATAAEIDAVAPTELKRESSAGLRRGSFSESNEDVALELKKTVSQEQERREKDSKVSEAIPEAAVESANATPMINAMTKEVAIDDSPLAHKEDKSSAKPETESSHARPAEATEAAVNGVEAHLPAAEDLKKKGQDTSAAEVEGNSKSDGAPQHKPTGKEPETASKASKKPASKPMTNGKPASISTKAPSKSAAASAKSPASQPKTPLSASTSTKTQSPRDPTKKTSRSSLTAPTAASAARTTSSEKTSPPAKTHNAPPPAKPRGATKPIDLPSRLTAPTTASKARQEQDSKPATATSATNGGESLSSRPKPSANHKMQTPRTSMAGSQQPESLASHASRKPAQSGGSFLERMTRPTAASSQKTHEKVEHKSPPRTSRTAAPAKPKTNGHVKKPAAKSVPKGKESEPEVEKSPPEESAEDSEKTHLNGGEPVDELVEEAKEAAEDAHAEPALAPAEKLTKEGVPGSETPTHHTNGHAQTDGALKATPAGFGGEETIR